MATVGSRQGTVTHEVFNQPPPMAGHNAFHADPALSEAVLRHGGDWGRDRIADFGAVVASEEALAHAKRAQRNVPVLRTHDRYGNSDRRDRLRPVDALDAASGRRARTELAALA